jgi:hypothetical protein
MEHEDINWTKVIASMVPDDPMDTSPDLQGYFAARMLARLGRNLAIGGAMWAARAQGAKDRLTEAECLDVARRALDAAFSELGRQMGGTQGSHFVEARGAGDRRAETWTRTLLGRPAPTAEDDALNPYKVDQWDTHSNSFAVVLGPGLVGLQASFPADEAGWAQARFWANRLNYAASRKP